VEAVQDFLAIGRDVNEQDAGGRSPLHYAVAYAHGEVVSELLEAGASLAAQVLPLACDPEWP
jgi:ankyrin repeat protein